MIAIRLLAGALTVAALVTAAAEVQAKPKIPFRVTSEPAGATVKLVKTGVAGDTVKATGTTPWETLVDDDWLHPGVVRRLEYPVEIVVSKPGYITKTYTVTELKFAVVGGGDSVAYFTLRSDTWHVNLYKPVDFKSSAPKAAPGTTGGQSTRAVFQAVSAATLKAVAELARPALVVVHAGAAYGSGFFVTGNGIIVTSRGVVGTSTTATVITDRGDSLPSQSVYVSADRDLAFIKVGGSGYPHLGFAGDGSVRAGEPVVAVGSALMPLSGRGIAEAGIASVTEPAGARPATRGDPIIAVGGIRAFGDTGKSGRLIQTDAAIYWGNAGGPLLNLRGEVVGVNTTDIVAVAQAREINGIDTPILTDSNADPEAVISTFVDTGGRPFEPDDSRQVISKGERFAIAASEVLELMKQEFTETVP